MAAPKKMPPECAEELMDKIKRRNPGFNPFMPKPGEETLAKAFWAAHWASKPSGGELYEGEL